jgi:HKD family nuclease
MDIQLALSESIQTGFIDQFVHSNAAYRPEFLVNDRSRGKKILSTLLSELHECEEFWFSVAFITTSGVATLMNTLIELEANGIKGKVLASQYLNFTQPEALKRIRKFKNIELRIATTGAFHSKGYLFKKEGVYDLIIGSSNLTQTALCTNKEWNLKVSASPQSELVDRASKEFNREFESAQPVTDDYLQVYEQIWKSSAASTKRIKKEDIERLETSDLSGSELPLAAEEMREYGAQYRHSIHSRMVFGQVQPNAMQINALKNIESLRAEGKNKALLISATGTGKTYLSAFDVRKVKPNRFLFIVHRRTIAEEAMKTFKSLMGDGVKMGIYSGREQDITAEYLFSTIQTISKQAHLDKFDPNHFDYIVIDETHRAGAKSYAQIMNHFKPKFLLGMTATPERTDGEDVFKLFDHNIAYEIRLHEALDAGMLSPFHYYGVSDITVDNQVIDAWTDFNLLTADERVDRIIEKAKLYGCDDGEVRGLVFCSRTAIAQQLSNAFNERSYKTLALSGENSEEEGYLSINLQRSNIASQHHR